MPEIILHISNNDLAKLWDLLHRSADTLGDVTDATFDYRRFVECDHRFHSNLIHLCDNSYIVKSYMDLNAHLQIGRVYSARALSRSLEGQLEHEAIYHAFADRDIRQARVSLQHHAERSLQSVLAVLEEHGGEL